MLAAKLARIYNKANEEQRAEFAQKAHDDMRDISMRIYAALESGELPPYEDINASNTERKRLVVSLANHPDARRYLLILLAGFVDVLQPGEDTLISTGFSVDEATQVTSAFESYCREHYDEIEAMRLIYNNEGEPITYRMLKDLEGKLKLANGKFDKFTLWNSYAVLSPSKVRHNSLREEKDALTNIIQLVRYALHQTDRLESLYPYAQQRFNLWFGQNQREITPQQVDIIRQVVNYIASNGFCTIQDIKEDDKTKAAQLSKAFGGLHSANEALTSLSQFILYRKSA
jgi:type I restriction enzyme R subunit